MKILLYIEPHPIRNTRTHFKDIAKRLLPLVGTHPTAEIRLFANEATLATFDTADGARSGILRATPEEEALIGQELVEWDSYGIPRWVSLMDGGEVADAYVRILERLYRLFPFDVVVHWGENGAVSRFIQDYPVARVALELGCTRPPYLSSIAMDPLGTNGAALLSHLTVDELVELTSERSLSAVEALYCYSEGVEAQPYEQRFGMVPLGLEELVAKRPERVAYLPLQLYDDANLLRFSSFDSISDVVLHVVPRLAERGITTIVKPHPASAHRPSALLENATARQAIHPWASQVVWCDPAIDMFPNPRLFELADFVVTVNSSAGFEALYHDKPVCVLGEAVYKPASAFPDLLTLAEGTFDRSTLDRATGAIRHFMLEAYLCEDAHLDRVDLFIERVVGIVAASREGTEAFQLASSLYRTRASQRATRLANVFWGGSGNAPVRFHYPTPSCESDSDKEVPDPLQLATRALMRACDARAVHERVAWIKAQWADESRFRRLVVTSGLFDSDYYLKSNPGVAEADIEAAHHYARFGRFEGRAPCASLDGRKFDLVELISVVETDGAGGEPMQLPLSFEEEAFMRVGLSAISDQLGSSDARLLVVCHLYYADLVPELLVALANIPEEFDLVVTMPQWGAERISQMVRERYPQALFCGVPNRGRDVGPFLEVLSALKGSRHKWLLKLQTKRGYYRNGRLRPDLGNRWREEALRALLPSPALITQILQAFETHPELNMVGPKPLLQPLTRYPYHDGGRLAASYGLRGDMRAASFFAGTMFWARRKCFRRLLDGGESLRLASFEPESGANDGCLAHLVERIFGHIASGTGGGFGVVDPKAPTSVQLRARPWHTSIHDYLSRSQSVR